MTKKILFLTGTRADFGKIKSLIDALAKDPAFEPHIFITGMHELKLYGRTAFEVIKRGYKNIHRFVNQYVGEPMEMILANTIAGLSRFTHENRYDMIVVHGDRVEALAGAIVGVMQNILVAHIEGGERSGTVDEMVRHSVSKLSHLHFVANNEARNRLLQMGESADSVFVIGSPDIDVMLSKNLPTIEAVKARYDIPFNQYAVAVFHPVTTEIDRMQEYAENFVNALLRDETRNYVVIYPNNDEGATDILKAYKRFDNHPRFRVFPSVRFEYFLTLLKKTEFCIGNSSAGIREAPFYGILTVNIGTRQSGRFQGKSVINTGYEVSEICAGIKKAVAAPVFAPVTHFGKGGSAEAFYALMTSDEIWKISPQKRFFDYPSMAPYQEPGEKANSSVSPKILEAV